MTIAHINTTFAPSKAEEVAAELNATSTEGLTFKVNHDPSGRGKSFIEIYDEEGYLVGKY